MKIHFIGVPLLVMGAKQSYGKIIELVEKTKKSAKSMNGPVVVLENS